MLWIALHFSALSLEIFSRGAAAFQPLVVFEKHGNRSLVHTCNEAASVSGVRPGMPVSAAQALVVGLVVRPRDLIAEQESLSGLASWAGRFTLSVSLQSPAGLLLEIGGCLSMHSGFDNLLGQVRSGLNEMDYSYTYACAPTSHAAWLLARAGTETVVRELMHLEKVLGVLPVRLLNQPLKILESLEMVGAYTLGDCLRLPRAGMARRFGQRLLDELDCALGRLPETHKFYVPPPSFERRLELPAQVQEAKALLFAVHRLLPELEGYLSLRQAGVQELELICCHEEGPDTLLKVGFVQATRSVDRMLLLLRETIGSTRLSAPIHTIILNARLILPLDVSNIDLFQDSSEAGDGNLLLERLRIRLGKEAVFGLEPTADHRPERAWRHCEVGAESRLPGNLRRPLWLLPKPLRCEEVRFVLKTGPERIESGWWDGMEVARDYYVALDRRGSHLWVYCDRSSEEWFVHGMFG